MDQGRQPAHASHAAVSFKQSVRENTVSPLETYEIAQICGRNSNKLLKINGTYSNIPIAC